VSPWNPDTSCRWTSWIAVLAIAIGAIAPTLAMAEEPPPMVDCLDRPAGCFTAGSYGRVQPSWDLYGGQGRPATLLSHGTRLELGPYAEIDFYYTKRLRPKEGVTLEVGAVVTLAFLEDLFHFTGDFDQSFALRNLYGFARGLAGGKVGFWAGSRMYRGDDIYLFDFWPLDSLNTYGGGVELDFDPLLIDVHVGTNRLRDDFQFQEVDVQGTTPDPVTVVYMDRQRTIASVKATYIRRLRGEMGFKAKLYGEFHGLPAGLLLDDDGNRMEELPADFGWLVGGQVGLWGWGRNAHVNLFARGAGGLGAYGEFGIPFGLDSDKKTGRAREFLAGFSANYEVGFFGIQAGGYLRYFRDADPNVHDQDDRWEFAVAARPHFFVAKYFQPFAEVSYQQLVPRGLSPETLAPNPASIVKLSVGPSVAFEETTWARPRFQVVYTASFLDEDARLLYGQKDPRRERAVQHYIGLGVEWWFNSSTY
jgi:hypothetical protein